MGLGTVGIVKQCTAIAKRLFIKGGELPKGFRIQGLHLQHAMAGKTDRGKAIAGTLGQRQLILALPLGLGEKKYSPVPGPGSGARYS